MGILLPIELSSHSKEDRHTVDFTSGADLQHLGGYFISGDKVLYVLLTATHHLQSQKHTMTACTSLVFLLLFPCLPSSLLHLSSIFCSSKHISTEAPLVLLRGSAVPCAGVAPEPYGTSPVPYGAAPTAPETPQKHLGRASWDPQDPQHHSAPGSSPLSHRNHHCDISQDSHDTPQNHSFLSQITENPTSPSKRLIKSEFTFLSAIVIKVKRTGLP